MKISCKRENLVKGLGVVSRLVRQRATLPVLANVMLSSDKGRLKLAATDLESSVVTWIGAKIDEEGAITVPLRTLFDYLSAASDETVSLVAQNSDVVVKSAHNQATVKGIMAEEFPVIPQVKSEATYSFGAKALKDAILAVSIAAAMDETRPVLAGVLFRVAGEKMKVVATDSYRLSEKTITLSKPAAAAVDIIIPARAANELARILPEDESIVELQVGENQAQFSASDIQFLSRQIEGAFPDYEQLIPKELAYEFEVDKNSFAEAIKVANVFARDAGNNIKFVASENQLTIDAISAQVGDSKTSLTVSSKGSPLNVAFNAKYILDAINVISGERIDFGLAGELNPGVIADKADSTFRYIVMPLRSE